jgi:DNA polymerase III delta prime subunit
MIINPADIAGKEKKMRVLIYGPPGLGKTTLAESAPKALLIDLDRGIERISAAHRTPVIRPDTYQDLLDDLTPENLVNFDTIVIDTLGQLMKLMGAHAIKQNPKNGQYDGTLSLKGFGAITRLFETFTQHCFYALGKHLVIVSHSKEQQDGDTTKARLLVDGSTKDNVFQQMDLAGYMQMQGNNRIIGFSPTEGYYAKSTFGIKGIEVVPELKPGLKNDYLTRLFGRVSNNIASEVQEIEGKREEYETAMKEAQGIIDAIKTAEGATAAIAKVRGLTHALTSERESKTMLHDKATALGFVYDKEKCAYVLAGTGEAKQKADSQTGGKKSDTKSKIDNTKGKESETVSDNDPITDEMWIALFKAARSGLGDKTDGDNLALELAREEGVANRKEMNRGQYKRVMEKLAVTLEKLWSVPEPPPDEDEEGGMAEFVAAIDAEEALAS